MKTVIIDHDTRTEIKYAGRFNNIIPLLKIYGCYEDSYEWANIIPETTIVQPNELPKYLNSDYNIIYAVTCRIPNWKDPQIDNGDDNHWLDELATEIPKDIIELANKGLLHISFFVGEIITLAIREILTTVDRQLMVAGINKESITVYIPNFKLDTFNFPHIKFISIFEMSYKKYLDRSDIPLSDNIIQSVNLKPRNKKFTCLNNLNKSHRLCIGAALYNSGKHLDGYFSYLGRDIVEGHPAQVLKELHKDAFLNALPFIIDTDDREVANAHWHVKKPFFNDAYWNFVTESFFADTHGLTEKTFKPIVNLQPFIIFGEAGSLVALHKLGYETFHSVIDESYDVTGDHDRRMRILIRLAHQLIDMSDDQHIKMMTKIKPILEHNQNVFFNKKWMEFI